MNIQNFITEFEQVFPEHERYTEDCNGYIDPIPEIEGAASPKSMWLLNLAYSFLDLNEAYLEIGAYHGKNLVAALRYNDLRPIYVCDDFSNYTKNNPLENFSYNMHRCKLTNKIILFNSAFQDILTAKCIPHKIGTYYYNGPHDAGSQYDSILFVEPILANDAIIIINNWNDPFVRKGTYEAVEGSENSWILLYDLPARHKEDVEMWWNGVSVFSFNRKDGEKE